MSGEITSRAAAALAGVLAILSTAACDNGPSAVQTRERADAPGAVLTSASLGGSAGTTTGSGSDTPEPKGVVTANRSETADAKITRLYQRNGAAFGARSAQDYAARMKAFAESPPAGVDQASRPNGDTLYYQASTNTFAVVSRDGTPRTMFKPDDGPTYWAEQKSRAPDFGVRRAKAPVTQGPN